MTTQTSIPCPECNLPWKLVAGRFPLHTLKGKTCSMSGWKPSDWTPPAPPEAYTPTAAPPMAAGQSSGQPKASEPPAAPVALVDKEPDTKPARKVRSDKGTKRRPRTGGGDSHASAVSDPALQAASGGPPSQAEKRVAIGSATMGDSEPTIWTAIATAGSSTPEAPSPAKRKPRRARAQYIVVGGGTPLYPSRKDAEETAKRKAKADSDHGVYVVYQVRLRSEASFGVQLRRFGRGRKAKQL